jgi:hypothetical protein
MNDSENEIKSQIVKHLKFGYHKDILNRVILLKGLTKIYINSFIG